MEEGGIASPFGLGCRLVRIVKLKIGVVLAIFLGILLLAFSDSLSPGIGSSKKPAEVR